MSIKERIGDIMENTLQHHGILGQKWGVRRYQNPDGSLTPAGRRRLEKQDKKWSEKNYNKIYNETYKKSRNELQNYVKYNKPTYVGTTKSTKRLSASYINAYNRKFAEVMNKNVSDIQAPSGKVVRFVAKRGEVGVHMALADRGYEMNQLKNGVWASGKISYKKKNNQLSIL